MALIKWWARLGLNQWPLPCEGSALPLSYAPRQVADDSMFMSPDMRRGKYPLGFSINASVTYLWRTINRPAPAPYCLPQFETWRRYFLAFFVLCDVFFFHLPWRLTDWGNTHWVKNNSVWTKQWGWRMTAICWFFWTYRELFTLKIAALCWLL